MTVLLTRFTIQIAIYVNVCDLWLHFRLLSDHTCQGFSTFLVQCFLILRVYRRIYLPFIQRVPRLRFACSQLATRVGLLLAQL